LKYHSKNNKPSIKKIGDIGMKTTITNKIFQIPLNSQGLYNKILARTILAKKIRKSSMEKPPRKK